MALHMKVDWNGVSIPEAYLQIVEVRYLKNRGVFIVVRFFANLKSSVSESPFKEEMIILKSVSENESEIIQPKFFPIDSKASDQKNLVALAYDYIKTLPEFSTAIDA